MAERIVDLLESVQVEHGKLAACAGAAVACDYFAHKRFESCFGEQAGQQVKLIALHHLDVVKQLAHQQNGNQNEYAAEQEDDGRGGIDGRTGEGDYQIAEEKASMSAK